MEQLRKMSEGSGPTKAKKREVVFYVKDMKYILTFNMWNSEKLNNWEKNV